MRLGHADLSQPTTVGVDRKVINILVRIQWGAFYLFITNFFATQIIGGTKELVVLL